MNAVPAKSQVVIIGGGIAGCSTAYHLAQLGWTDIILLERGKLTSGSTWHAAGMVGQLRSTSNITKLLSYSVDLYARLEKETGLATGWKANGSLRLCCTKERRIEFLRQLTTARSFGLEMELLSPREIETLCPGIVTSDLDSGLYVASDGVANPSDLVMSLAKGARLKGVRIFEDTPVLDVDVRDGRVRAVTTTGGRIECDAVVVCGGIWSRELAKSVGVRLPIQAAHHQYFVTEPINGLRREMPSLRDPDNLTYFKEEVGGLVAGGYEANPISYSAKPSLNDEEFKLFPEFMDHFEQFMPAMMRRFPALSGVGIKKWYNGLESFTEDTNFIIGEAPEVKGFFVGCGFNAMGIAAGGGAGMALAHWVAHGEPPFDLWPVDIRRFSAFHASDRNVLIRSLEGQGHHYAMHWPHFEFQAGRPLRRSALYDRLTEAGACFGGKSGWERPNWFAPVGVEAKDTYTFERPNWFEQVAAEHRACRESAAIFDQSSFSKFMLVGRNAEEALQRICSADLGRQPGRVTYTQMLNERGGVECDLTITRLSQDSYYIVTGTAVGDHDRCYITSQIKQDEDVHCIDVTSAFGVLGLMGPLSRAILAQVAEADLDSKSFPFGQYREIIIAGAPVRALRVTFVGELGWELHIPTEYMVTVYDALKNAGQQFGLKDAGYRAIDSLRIEKGFCVWGAEVSPDDTPLEAGLRFAVAFNKPTPFTGREALVHQRQRPLKRRLATLVSDSPEVILLGRETIYRNGEPVGWLTSGGYGHSIGKPLGLGYIRNPAGVTDDYLLSAQYELEVAGERVSATIVLGAAYDPKNTKSRI
ncbi:FAD-dependent oxidoreductase [Mesorhizobium tianshanense]|uniref:4-methylaminobutanoate oxidase (Formaldehyde-forming) n=2 Tax=Mesorhizobium tianshanense TaxID=39844 RepID=A0A562NM26_9HYPH|nr:FAD-dependent oxidoreductase [Mesorhizobium tianshanense]TWI33173.1 4-methylaminobutanoate oxidase (formaldehyde-forming) [Mesorhizobium tianshanense]GLS34954.1 FAD-dependent oxidoreductase [Mesorhizobium tianshanense]